MTTLRRVLMESAKEVMAIAGGGGSNGVSPRIDLKKNGEKRYVANDSSATTTTTTTAANDVKKNGRVEKKTKKMDRPPGRKSAKATNVVVEVETSENEHHRKTTSQRDDDDDGEKKKEMKSISLTKTARKASKNKKKGKYKNKLRNSDGSDANEQSIPSVAAEKKTKKKTAPLTNGKSKKTTSNLPLIDRIIAPLTALLDAPKKKSASDLLAEEFALPQEFFDFAKEQEKLELSRITGTRTREVALAEFKHVTKNEYVHLVAGNGDGSGERAGGGNRSSSYFRSDDDDGEGGTVDACVCGLRPEANSQCGDTSCLNRATNLECDKRTCPVELKTPGACKNMRIQRERRPKVDVREVVGRGCGLFILEPVTKGTLIIEYLGEVVDEEECERRLREDYAKERHKYLMRGTLGVIDATRRGNVARFINHSCDANCVVQEWRARGRNHMVIVAKEDLKAETELSFDYNFQRYGEGKQKCYCGSKSCKGFLGRDDEDESEEDDDEDAEGSKWGEGAEAKRRRILDPFLRDDVSKIIDSKKYGAFLTEMGERRRRGIAASRKEDWSLGVFLPKNVDDSLARVYDDEFWKGIEGA